MADTPNVAASWLAALASRGVGAEIRNGRLRLVPATAYKDLSDDEHAVLRHHRAEIMALVAAGAPVALAFPVQDATSGTVAPTLAPEPPPCPHCMGECVGASHPAFEVLHALDPRLVAQRDEIATREMFESLRRQAGRPPTINHSVGDEFAHLPPEIAEREREMKAERIRRGWEHPHGVGVRRAL